MHVYFLTTEIKVPESMSVDNIKGQPMDINGWPSEQSTRMSRIL